MSEITDLTAEVRLLREALQGPAAAAYKGRRLTRAEVCRLLGMCPRTLMKYWRLYQLPMPRPEGRNCAFSFDDVQEAAKVLAQHGKLRYGIFNL